MLQPLSCRIIAGVGCVLVVVVVMVAVSEAIWRCCASETRRSAPAVASAVLTPAHEEVEVGVEEEVGLEAAATMRAARYSASTFAPVRRGEANGAACVGGGGGGGAAAVADVVCGGSPRAVAKSEEGIGGCCCGGC